MLAQSICALIVVAALAVRAYGVKGCPRLEFFESGSIPLADI